ncbi:hypothetical protein RFI_33378, partial [Reticulomyxa filosa]
DYHVRCNIEENLEMKKKSLAWKSGDMSKMFESIISNYEKNKNDIEWTLTVISKDPYVFQLDNFFSDLECNAVVAAAPPFERSTDVGEDDGTGHFAHVTSESRTSMITKWSKVSLKRCLNSL